MEDYDFLFLRKAIKRLEKVRRDIKTDLKKRKMRKTRRNIRKFIKWEEETES